MKRLATELASVLALLWGVATLVFLLVELSPGSVVDKHVGPDASPELRAVMVHKLGLDQPLPERYLRQLGAWAQGDLGVSLVHERPVGALLVEALPATLLLGMSALLLAFPAGVALGVRQARRAGRAEDAVSSTVLLGLAALPTFLVAVLLQVAAPRLGLPMAGLHDTVRWESMGSLGQAVDRLQHLVLPTLALATGLTAVVARHTRSSVLTVQSQDFVLAARARGLTDASVLRHHILPHAMLPVITLLGLALPGLVGGSALVESIFAWPGMGRLLVDATLHQDTPVIVGCLGLSALAVNAGQRLTDALQRALDPRLRDV